MLLNNDWPQRVLGDIPPNRAEEFREMLVVRDFVSLLGLNWNLPPPLTLNFGIKILAKNA